MSVATEETDQAVHDQDLAPSPFKIRITARFVLLCFASTIIPSFGLGWACRNSLLRLVAKSLPGDADAAPGAARQMPRLVLPDGKPMPNAVYTSKHFDTALTTCDSVLLTKVSSPFPAAGTCNEEDQTCRNPESDPAEATGLAADDEHQPVGQHLLVDIKNVDESFLDSKERLAQAMVTLVEESGTTMLSYHCHKLEPTGVSCVGVLLESHIAFHTWPEAGVITLDMFTCGTVQMLPLLGVITRVCGVPETPMIEPPVARWAFKRRGFPSQVDDDGKAEDRDLDRYVLGSMEPHGKVKVAEQQTEIQRVEIYDVASPRSRTYGAVALQSAKERSFESLHEPPVLPDRIMYTDNVMQSRRYGEKEYHEALVHPAMMAHENPARVAILGGGDGAALREVLKHGTVQHVTMIEIDRGVVELSRRYLPEWSSCGVVGGRIASCFDDIRTDLVYADAVAWFKDNFGAGAAPENNERFDVVIMDALDQSPNILFRDEDFIAAVSNALSPTGVLVAQVGKASRMNDAPREFARRTVLDAGLVSELTSHRFVKVRQYSEGHGGLRGPWTFLVAFKDERTSDRWFATEAEVELATRERILLTQPGSPPPLRYFDGSVMRSYSFPSRVAEENYCRTDPSPSLCRSGHGFDPERPSAPAPSLVATADDHVFNESFPESTYVAIEESVHDLAVLPRARLLIRASASGVQGSALWDALAGFVLGHGLDDSLYGGPPSFVSSGIAADDDAPRASFCNRPAGAPPAPTADYETADYETPSAPGGSLLLLSASRTAAYDPFVDRNPAAVLLSAAAAGRCSGPAALSRRLADGGFFVVRSSARTPSTAGAANETSAAAAAAVAAGSPHSGGRSGCPGEKEERKGG